MNFSNRPCVVKNYVLEIDSEDRDLLAYPSPYHFKVRFDPQPNSYDADGCLVLGSPSPIILKKFKNVVRIKLESIIVPRQIGNVDVKELRFLKLFLTGSDGSSIGPNTKFSTGTIPFAKLFVTNNNENDEYANPTIIDGVIETDNNAPLNLNFLEIKILTGNTCPLFNESVFLSEKSNNKNYSRGQQICLTFTIGVLEPLN